MRNLPHTVQEAFNLADRIETQIQVADSFKMKLSNDFLTADINEVNTEETSGDEIEMNKVTRNGKRGYNNNYKKGNYGNNQIFSNKPHYNSKTQENKPVKTGNTKKRIKKQQYCRNLHISFQ